MSFRSARPLLRVVTSSWFTELPPDIVRIGISRGPPRGQRGYRRLPDLAPGPWHKTASEQEYISLYRTQLEALDPYVMIDRVRTVTAGASCAALLCFEQAEVRGVWCHRSLAADWLSKALGSVVDEWGYEHQTAHPLLPPSLRKQREKRSPAFT
jgi:hypothetical protein